MNSVPKEVLARAEKIIIESAEKGSSLIKNGDSEFVPLEPLIDHSKPPAFKIGEVASEDLSAKTEIKADETDVNEINIWQDKTSGRCAISIGTVIHEIPVPVFELFTRMVANVRILTSDLETERFNNKKLKRGLV